ncbi:prolipoprotein diacylglyceryl transferase [Nanoarchaeota archaeon]
MYTLNLDPVIFSIGSLDIKWYSLFYLLGFVFLYAALKYVSIKKGIEGLNEEKIENFLIYAVLGIVIGSRLGYFLFYNISELFTLELFKFWNGGLSFHGGLIGGLIATALFSKKNKISFLPLFNISILAGIFALALGRIANFINGRLVGTEFDGLGCVVFPAFDNVCRHPYPIYASISHFLLFGYLMLIIYFHRHWIKNFLGRLTITINFLIGYGILRIITDIWKVDNVILGIKTGQWLSVFMIIAGIILLFYEKAPRIGKKK